MRLFPLFCSFVLLAGPAFGQQLALTPAAKPDCPPVEPDSLQISWNEPCDKGDWLFDTETGCRMWDWHPEPEDKAVWNGACRAGQPNGPGEAQWTEHGRPIDRFVGIYRDGKREGLGSYRWNDVVSFEGNYADDVPHGSGTVRIAGTVLTGQWRRGCLTTDGKTVAIGVPRAACGSESTPAPKVADR
jgi:hypothetical protein